MSTKTLHDYNDVEPLTVREIQEVRHGDTIVGWAGPSNRDKNVAVCHRHRYPYGERYENQEYAEEVRTIANHLQDNMGEE